MIRPSLKDQLIGMLTSVEERQDLILSIEEIARKSGDSIQEVDGRYIWITQ